MNKNSNDDEQEYTICSLADVFRVEFKSNFDSMPKIFRGQADFAWGALPSLYRHLDFRLPFNLKHRHGIEAILIGKFFSRAEPYLGAHRRNFLRDRMLAQHYGVPTRLLDWSQNPLIALYFAVEDDRYDCDGALFCGLASANWTGAVEKAREEDVLCVDFVSLIPPSLDTRITAQTAILTVQNQTMPDNRFVHMEDYEFPKKTDYVKKIRIPRAAKSQIYQELQSIGITRWSIYPSIQGVGEGVNNEFRRVWGYTTF